MQTLVKRARKINNMMDGIQFWSLVLGSGIYDSEDIIHAAEELRSLTEEYTTFYYIARRVANTESGTDVAAVLAKVDNSVRTAVDLLSRVLVFAAQNVFPPEQIPVEIPALPGRLS